MNTLHRLRYSCRQRFVAPAWLAALVATPAFGQQIGRDGHNKRFSFCFAKPADVEARRAREDFHFGSTMRALEGLYPSRLETALAGVVSCRVNPT